MEMWEINGVDFENGKVMAIYVSHDYLDLDNTKFVPARPRGEWIMHKNFDGHLRFYECPNCGNTQGYLSNYCEVCGSDNREE
jgi:hypothetical protein